MTSPERTLAAYVLRARIGLVVMGILYAWTSYHSYLNVRPWLDGSLLANEPTGELERLLDTAYLISVFTLIASAVNVVLVAFAGKRTRLAIYIATSIFAVYTALRLYQTGGGYLSTWVWWVIAIVLGVSFQAAHKAHQLRLSRQLANARVVA